MKNKLLYLLLISFCIVSFSQKIENITTEKFSIEKLAATCKVWGFLKYYHPNVADGSKNWDEQLFIILPKIKNAYTAKEFSIVLENWISNLGVVPIALIKNQNSKIEYFDKNFDLSWIDNQEFFSPQLSKSLRFIEKNRFQGKQFYVCSNCGVDNNVTLAMQNEIQYSDFKWDNTNLRLLTMFRYWNLVEYFYPYKYQMDIKWNVTLLDMLPRFTNCASEIDYFVTLKELVARLNDSHANFYNMKFQSFIGLNLVPFTFKIIDDKVLITGLYVEEYAKENDLKIGDVITKFDNKTIAELIKENKKYISGSTDASIIENFKFVLLTGIENTVEIDFTRDDVNLTKKIKRYGAEKLNIKLEYNESNESIMLPQNVGYVNLGKLQVKNIPKIMNDFKYTNAIIFDARYYPSETLLTLADFLNPEKREYAKCLVNNLNYPGRYTWISRFCGKKNSNFYKGKVVVLVNEKTFSMGEFLVMVLQTAPNVTVVGSQTAGADGPNCSFQIMTHFKTSFSGFGVFYPNKTETQRIGIVPQILVKPTITGLQQGLDEVLNRAMRYIIRNE